jgi:DNA-directed RNA polymerase specialized sigma24 family protein
MNPSAPKPPSPPSPWTLPSTSPPPPSNPPPTDPSPPTDPPSADRSVASGGQLAFLTFGLLLFVLLFALPMILFFWIASALIGSVGVAEALEHTRGLAPTTYGGAFWLAVAFTGVMALLELRAIASAKKGAPGFLRSLLTRPSAGLFGLFVPTFFLVRADIKGTDVPDILTTTLLLCCLGYVYFIVPLPLLAASWRLTRWMWKIGKNSGFASGALGTLGLAFATCVPLVCAGSDESPDDEASTAAFAAFERGIKDAEGKGPVDGSLALLTALAEDTTQDPPLQHAPASGVPWLGAGSKDRFDECIHTLHRDSDSKSARDQTIQYFVVRGTERDLAEQIVQEALLEVCLGHAKNPYEDLTGRFVWLSKRRRTNIWRRRNVADSCTIEVQWTLYDPEDASPERHAVALALNRALCQLDDQDVEILRATANGFDATEIGRMLSPPMAAATVRKRRERAVRKLREQLQ